jgi:hypothetical protein
MADQRLADMTAATAPYVGTEIVYGNQSSVDVKMTTQALANRAGVLVQNSQSVAYTTVMGDINKHILHPSSDNNPRTFTIDSNANVAYEVGVVLVFVNMINTVTIAINADTMYLAGTGATGSRSLAAYGIATALKLATTTWLISGTNIT